MFQSNHYETTNNKCTKASSQLFLYHTFIGKFFRESLEATLYRGNDLFQLEGPTYVFLGPSMVSLHL